MIATIPLATPTPTYKLGDLVRDCGSAPYLIDGMRLEVESYEEDWGPPPNEDQPCRLHPEQPGWQYHLVRMGRDKHGNEQVREWGWVAEEKLSKE